MKWLRNGLLAVSLAGVLFSAGGLSLTFLNAAQIEESSRNLVIPRVEAKIRELMTPKPVEGDGKMAALRNRLVEKAKGIADEMLGSDYADRIREQVAELCVCRMTPVERDETLRRYDDAKGRVNDMFEAAVSGKFSELRMEKGTLKDLVGGYYVDTVEGLLRELRIFFGLNLVLFGLVGAVSFFAAPSPGLLVPAGLLFASTVWAGYLFIFNQNWLATVVFHTWSGYGYLILVVILFLCLMYFLRKMGRAATA